MKQPAQHLMKSMKISARMMAIGILKSSNGQPCMREVMAVDEVPRAEANLALTTDEVGMQIVFAT